MPCLLKSAVQYSLHLFSSLLFCSLLFCEGTKAPGPWKGLLPSRIGSDSLHATVLIWLAAVHLRGAEAVGFLGSTPLAPVVSF